jgi:hypothetical protein
MKISLSAGSLLEQPRSSSWHSPRIRGGGPSAGSVHALYGQRAGADAWTALRITLRVPGVVVKPVAELVPRRCAARTISATGVPEMVFVWPLELWLGESHRDD